MARLNIAFPPGLPFSRLMCSCEYIAARELSRVTVRHIRLCGRSKRIRAQKRRMGSCRYCVMWAKKVESNSLLSLVELLHADIWQK
jgi:hypothetical protein